MTELLRVADVAKVFGRSEDYVLRRIHAPAGRPRLRALKDGNEFFILQSDLDAYLEAIAFKPAPAPIDARAFASDQNLERVRHLRVLARRGIR